MRVRRARRRRGRPAASGRLEKKFSADAAVGPISARFAQNCATLRGRARTRSGVDRARCDAYRIGKTLSIGIDFLSSSHSSALRFRTSALVRRHEKPRRCFANQNARRRCAPRIRHITRCHERVRANDPPAIARRPPRHPSSTPRRRFGGRLLPSVRRSASSTAAGKLTVGWIARPVDAHAPASALGAWPRPASAKSPTSCGCREDSRVQEQVVRNGAPGTRAVCAERYRQSAARIRAASNSRSGSVRGAAPMVTARIRSRHRPRLTTGSYRRAQYRSPRGRRGVRLRASNGNLCWLVPRRAAEPAD